MHLMGLVGAVLGEKSPKALVELLNWRIEESQWGGLSWGA